MKYASHKSILVIPSINGGSLLERMLPTLRFPADRVVVLDQGSTDSTLDVCAQAGVEVRQLGRPHTYTEACNIGAAIARERGIAYLGIANNDIVFRSDVLGHLAAELDADPLLAIVAPAQVVEGGNFADRPLSSRVSWNLDEVSFFHDLENPVGAGPRLEADFCELTCALIRMEAIDAVGFLDDAYGFYHEDADFGFRLRQAGWNCAYLSRTQIIHYESSTVNREKAFRKQEFIAKNKLYFAQKLLGQGVDFKLPERSTARTTNFFAADLHRSLQRYGLLDRFAPELRLGSSGTDHAGYLFTALDSVDRSRDWTMNASATRGVFVPSRSAQSTLERAGIQRIAKVPLGIEPDIFHPWGLASWRDEDRTYLAPVNGYQTRSLSMILRAWHGFAAHQGGIRLRLFGSGLQDALGRIPDTNYRAGPLEIARFEAERIDIYEPSSPLDADELADLYRSVDFALFTSCDEGDMLPLLQAQACGVPCIFGRYEATEDLAFAGALTFVAETSVSEPDVEDLLARLRHSASLSARDHSVLSRLGMSNVRGRFTLRHTAMGLNNALAALQPRDPSRFIETLKRKSPSKDLPTLAQKAAPARLLGRISGVTARRVQSVGRLTTQLGSEWERRGLPQAGRLAGAELRLFMRHRSRQLSHTARKFTILKKRAPAQQLPIDRSTLLFGYVEGHLGLGQAARSLAAAMTAGNVPFHIYPIDLGIEGRRAGPFMSERHDKNAQHLVNILYVTPDELPHIVAHVGEAHFKGSYNILRTYWELNQAPASWSEKLAGIDEIWAPNAFVANSFRSVFEGEIILIPPCIVISDSEFSGRSHFGLEEDRFIFLFSFDYYSFPDRKNPLAVLHAFQKAFPNGDKRVGLVIKATGAAAHYPELREELRSAARYDPRIRIIDDYLGRSEMLSLLRAADCYVSMHRAEGFGLGMAEAMALGKPVIATDYSGSSDFLSKATGYPVSYRLKPVGPHDYVHYAEGQVWAEPSEADCATAMQSVANDPGAAALKASAGRAFVERRYAPKAVGALVAERLRQIHERL